MNYIKYFIIALLFFVQVVLSVPAKAEVSYFTKI